MKRISLLRINVILVIALLFTVQAQAKIALPNIFADNMLLQQQTHVNIWGTATPDKQVTISPTWTTERYTTTANRKGVWEMSFPTPKAGGPYEITFSDGDELVLKNVLIGELWICSGQSNMEMPMKGFTSQPVMGGNKAILHSSNPNLRLFTAQRQSSLVPEKNLTGTWQEAKPETVREFSATAYYFGREIESVLQVPVGLLTIAWGGSSCEAWMSEDMLKAFPDLKIPQKKEEVKRAHQDPTLLYNGMFHPIIGLVFRGVIWYQGETNCNRADQYADLFANLIHGWRNKCSLGEFPFFYCQIAPYDYSVTKSQNHLNSAYLREAQAKVEQMVPNTGMAVLIDVGFNEGIHPYNKEASGERLALLALNKTYGMNGFASQAPCYKDIEISHDTVFVNFDRVDNLWLAAKYGFESKEFKLAGEDRKFYQARAVIDRKNRKLYVVSQQVPHPVAVRYAFENTSKGDLFGTSELPISSFRSDDWPDELRIE